MAISNFNYFTPVISGNGQVIVYSVGVSGTGQYNGTGVPVLVSYLNDTNIIIYQPTTSSTNSYTITYDVNDYYLISSTSLTSDFSLNIINVPSSNSVLYQYTFSLMYMGSTVATRCARYITISNTSTVGTTSTLIKFSQIPVTNTNNWIIQRIYYFYQNNTAYAISDINMYSR
jgi:hypothetical protein